MAQSMTHDTASDPAVMLRSRDYSESRALREVAVANLIVDEDYQRARNDARVDEIVSDLSWALFGVLTVSDRENGLYAVIDGQNRAEAARRLGIDFVPALIMAGLTRAEEAAIFSDLQRKRRNISAIDCYRADLAAKRVRECDIATVLNARSIVVGRTHRQSDRLFTVAAISAVKDVWGWAGAPLVERVFDAVMVAWPTADGRFRAEIIRSLGRYVVQHDPDQWRLVLALESIGGPDTLMERAGYLRRGKGTGRGTEKYPVQVIAHAYECARATKPKDRDEMGRET